MSENIQKQIEEIEAEMARTQKNKATNYHLGTLKAKLAKLRSELLNGPGKTFTWSCELSIRLLPLYIMC